MAAEQLNSKYLETSILTATREELVLKIFDGLIMFATQAHGRLLSDPGDIEGIHRALLQAQRACSLLMGSLDFEIGGELSHNLFAVYGHWHHELVKINMRQTPDGLTELIADFKEYRQTWAQAIKEYKAQQVEGFERVEGGYAGIA